MAIYEVVLPSGIRVSKEMDLEFDDPRKAKACLEELIHEFGNLDIKICRDGMPISLRDLEAACKDHEIRTVMEHDATLPTTYRRGRTGDSDIGSGTDGSRHGVWKPRNPEDDYN